MKRKIFVLLLIGLFLCGCQMNYDEDYLTKYKTYLHFAFKDYTVIKNERKEYNSSPIPAHGEFNQYEISYLADDGQTYGLSFDNRDDFHWTILDHAKRRSEEEVLHYFENVFPGFKESEALDIFYSLEVPRDKEGHNKYSKKMLSGKEFFFFEGKGLQFTHFDISTLKNYQISFSFIINYDMQFGQDYGSEEEFKQTLLSVFEQLAELFQSDQWVAHINIGDSADNWIKYSAEYNKDTKTIVYNEITP